MSTVIDQEEFLFEDELAQLEPAPRLRHLDWCCQNIQNDRGEPYNHGAYPHLGAPGGPADAFDDPYIRNLVKMFGTRLGKTFFGQTCICNAADQDPGPMMFASSVEKLAKEVVARTYRMLERCRPLVGQLPRPDLRSMDRIEFDHCTVQIGWARSPSTLGDKDAKVGHWSEVDKWERHSTSNEADPLDLALDRGKDITNHKMIIEGTPTIVVEESSSSAASNKKKQISSRIKAWYERSSGSRYYVPCPHCAKYQTLEMNRIRWDKREDGSSDTDLARTTAHYVCAYCEERITDHHRHGMMRLGVWVPAGCGIDHAEAMRVAKRRFVELREGTFSSRRPGKFWKQSYLIGEPARDGVTAGFHLSSLYALALAGWGAIAAKWVEAQGNPTSLQNFINQWLAETWSPKREEKFWETLAAKLIVPVKRMVAPEWASLVFIGIDRQLDHYKYVLRAYGPGWRRHDMDYGRATSLQALYDGLIVKQFEHEDGGKIGVSYAVCDYGGDPKESTEICQATLEEREGYPVKLFLVKGNSTPLTTAWRESETSVKSAIPGLPLFLVDGDWTQGETDQLLHHRNLLSVFSAPVIEHKAYCEELLNEHRTTKLNPKTKALQAGWSRKDENRPNDLRDCSRYLDVIVDIWLGGEDFPTRGQMLAQAGFTAPATTPRITMPDGRPFCILNR